MENTDFEHKSNPSHNNTGMDDVINVMVVDFDGTGEYLNSKNDKEINCKKKATDIKQKYGKTIRSPGQALSEEIFEIAKTASRTIVLSGSNRNGDCLDNELKHSLEHSAGKCYEVLEDFSHALNEKLKKEGKQCEFDPLKHDKEFEEKLKQDLKKTPRRKNWDDTAVDSHISGIIAQFRHAPNHIFLTQSSYFYTLYEGEEREDEFRKHREINHKVSIILNQIQHLKEKYPEKRFHLHFFDDLRYLIDGVAHYFFHNPQKGVAFFLHYPNPSVKRILKKKEIQNPPDRLEYFEHVKVSELRRPPSVYTGEGQQVTLERPRSLLDQTHIVNFETNQLLTTDPNETLSAKERLLLLRYFDTQREPFTLTSNCPLEQGQTRPRAPDGVAEALEKYGINYAEHEKGMFEVYSTTGEIEKRIRMDHNLRGVKQIYHIGTTITTGSVAKNADEKKENHLESKSDRLSFFDLAKKLGLHAAARKFLNLINPGEPFPERNAEKIRIKKAFIYLSYWLKNFKILSTKEKYALRNLIAEMCRKYKNLEGDGWQANLRNDIMEDPALIEFLLNQYGKPELAKFFQGGLVLPCTPEERAELIKFTCSPAFTSLKPRSALLSHLETCIPDFPKGYALEYAYVYGGLKTHEPFHLRGKPVIKAFQFLGNLFRLIPLALGCLAKACEDSNSNLRKIGYLLRRLWWISMASFSPKNTYHLANVTGENPNNNRRHLAALGCTLGCWAGILAMLGKYGFDSLHMEKMLNFVDQYLPFSDWAGKIVSSFGVGVSVPHTAAVLIIAAGAAAVISLHVIGMLTDYLWDCCRSHKAAQPQPGEPQEVVNDQKSNNQQQKLAQAPSEVPPASSTSGPLYSNSSLQPPTPLGSPRKQQLADTNATNTNAASQQLQAPTQPLIIPTIAEPPQDNQATTTPTNQLGGSPLHP